MKTLEVSLGRSHAFVRGYQARDLLVSVGSRPLWSPISKAWGTSRHRGIEASELAQLKGYVVTLIEGESTRSARSAPDVHRGADQDVHRGAEDGAEEVTGRRAHRSSSPPSPERHADEVRGLW